ncbi:inosine triphosphate pyrophosphatase [Nematocida major]|uniref:inosine triphosphate pyrophosphatase n=1 Tax=Nematocida major TaxID=1912982 RepID=UPI002008A34E|nr:inosine triphosphate pyrophosphatase [Nematocida major]KAH9386682.1 inosine triphosphate pyrophosphatase [Nematocida major]
MIAIVTGSPRKQKEIEKYIDGRIEYTFVSHDLVEIQGTSLEVVKHKLLSAHKLVNGPVLVEDYSLYIDILCGFPGPYVKSLLGNGELGRIVKNLSPLGEIACTAECVYGYIDANAEVHIFTQKSRGVLVPSEEEASGLFGIDQLLVQEGTSKPFHYLEDAEKDEHSVRRKTLDKVIKHIEESGLTPQARSKPSLCVENS